MDPFFVTNDFLTRDRDKLTLDANDYLVDAENLALSYSHMEYTPLHLALAILLSSRPNILTEALNGLHGSSDESSSCLLCESSEGERSCLLGSSDGQISFKQALEESMKKIPSQSSSHAKLHPIASLIKLVKRADENDVNEFWSGGLPPPFIMDPLFADLAFVTPSASE